MYFGDNSGLARKATNAFVGAPVVRLTNLVPAMNGATGWSAGTSSTAHTKYSPASLLLTGTTSTVEVYSSTTAAIPMVAGRKYYVRTEVFFSSGMSSSGRRSSCYWPIAEPLIWSTSALGMTLPANEWVLLAMITDRGAAGFTSGNYPLRVDFDNDKRAGQMWIDGVMVIDLTAAYGAGNEPTSGNGQGWLNDNLPYFSGTLDFFDGTTAVSKAQKVKKVYMGDDTGKAKLMWDNT